MQLHQQRKEFEEVGVQVLAVSFETTESTRNYVKASSLEWPILLDNQKILYRYFGMRTAGFWDIWGYRTWKAYFKELLRGRLPQKGEGDIQQRGGNVILDADGRVRLHHISKGPGDRPAVEHLLQVLKEAAESQIV